MNFHHDTDKLHYLAAVILLFPHENTNTKLIIS